jgi:hypothetical protein
LISILSKTKDVILFDFILFSQIESTTEDDTLAACLSWLPLMEKPTAGDNAPQDFKINYLPKDTQEILCNKTFFADDYCDHEWSMMLINPP